jgi:perosamine synthetase
MSSLQAALGLAQLERIDELIARKQEIFAWYQRELQDIEELRLNPGPPETRNSYWMVTVSLEGASRLPKEELIERLADQGIDARPFFHPLSALPAFQDLDAAREASRRNRTAYAISPFAVNLPSALNLEEQQVVYVCDCLKSLLRQRGQFTSSPQRDQESLVR